MLPAAERVAGPATDTARRASTVTSCYGNTLFAETFNLRVALKLQD